MAVVTLRDTLKPWKDMVRDISLTFRPYSPKDGLEPTPRYLNLIREYRHDEAYYKNYLNNSIWGDVAQFPRGLVNVGKGVLRILRGAIKLVPPLFLIWCVYKMFTENDYLANLEPANYKDPQYSRSFWLAFKGELKGLGYDFVNGIGILLRGALQMATTPLTFLFRMPIRYFNTPEYVPKKFESEDEEEILVTGDPVTHTHTHTHSPVSQPTCKHGSSADSSDEDNNPDTNHTTGYFYTHYTL